MHQTIIEGDTFTCPADDGVDVVLSNGVGPELVEKAAGGAGATFARLPAGLYWLALRGPDGTTRGGTLEVQPIADQVRVRLVEELRALDDELADLDRTVEFQKVDSNAQTTAIRTTLSSLRKQRAMAEARLADYDRKIAGRPPCL